MKSFIKTRVVKSYDVEVLGPHLVQGRTEKFENLTAHLTIVNAAEKEQENKPKLPDEAIEADEVTRLWADAQAQATEILAKAKEEAEKLQLKAQAEVEKWQQETEESLRAEILAQAHEEGYNAGLQDALQERERLCQEAQNLFKLAERALNQEYAQVDEELLDLSLQIAKRIVRAQMSFQPENLLMTIRALTLLPQEREGWLLHLAPQDADWVSNLSPEEQPPCPVLVDETLKPGDCLLECQEGIFDARLEGQLERLEQVLREELNHGEMGRACS